jgi:hypothetical protein
MTLLIADQMTIDSKRYPWIGVLDDGFDWGLGFSSGCSSQILNQFSAHLVGFDKSTFLTV